MKVPAYAKVNLSLDILRANEDGYHAMDMINARASLKDDLHITPSDADEVIFHGRKMPEVNTLTRALHLLHQHGLQGHYKVEVIKNIPDKAGLGGGSADAAALLQALRDLEQLPLSDADLEAIGLQIGSDVPACLHTGFLRVGGRGEVIKELPVSWSIPVLLVQGSGVIDTREAFRRWDEHPSLPIDIDIVRDALLKRDIGLLYQTMNNALEEQAMRHLPDLAEVREDMLDAGMVRVVMTGSGSCLMGFCVDEEVMDEAYGILKNKYPFVWKGVITNDL